MIEAGTLVAKVNPRGTIEWLSCEAPSQDCMSAVNIKMRRWSSPKLPADMESLLVEMLGSLIIEAGSPQASAVGNPQGGIGFTFGDGLLVFSAGWE